MKTNEITKAMAIISMIAELRDQVAELTVNEFIATKKLISATFNETELKQVFYIMGVFDNNKTEEEPVVDAEIGIICPICKCKPPCECGWFSHPVEYYAEKVMHVGETTVDAETGSCVKCKSTPCVCGVKHLKTILHDNVFGGDTTDVTTEDTPEDAVVDEIVEEVPVVDTVPDAEPAESLSVSTGNSYRKMNLSFREKSFIKDSISKGEKTKTIISKFEMMFNKTVSSSTVYRMRCDVKNGNDTFTRSINNQVDAVDLSGLYELDGWIYKEGEGLLPHYLATSGVKNTVIGNKTYATKYLVMRLHNIRVEKDQMIIHTNGDSEDTNFLNLEVVKLGKVPKPHYSDDEIKIFAHVLKDNKGDILTSWYELKKKKINISTSMLRKIVNGGFGAVVDTVFTQTEAQKWDIKKHVTRINVTPDVDVKFKSLVELYNDGSDVKNTIIKEFLTRAAGVIADHNPNEAKRLLKSLGVSIPIGYISSVLSEHAHYTRYEPLFNNPDVIQKMKNASFK